MSVADTGSRFGLPRCLWIPIAATGIEALQAFVGIVLRKLEDQGRVNAVLVKPHQQFLEKDPRVPLWKSSFAKDADERLHPPQQVWVDVRYNRYRTAYIELGMPSIPAGYFLDHVQNRTAIAMRGFSHPLVRLCPVSRAVNTNAGHSFGMEGMEKDYVDQMMNTDGHIKEEFQKRIDHAIVYADPSDLTKMLNISPGTIALKEVGTIEKLFYPC